MRLTVLTQALVSWSWSFAAASLIARSANYRIHEGGSVASVVSWIEVQTLDGGVVLFRSDDGELMGKEESVSSKILMAYFPAETAESVKSKRELFNALDSYEFESLKARLETMIESGDESQTTVVESILSDLLLYAPFDLDPLISKLISITEFVGYSILRGGARYTKEELYRQLPTNPNFALIGLAWVGDEETVDQFSKWRAASPIWAEKLHCPAYQYSYEAGWELTPDNRKRELFFRTCFGLRRSPPTESAVDPSEKCASCHRALFYLNVKSVLLETAFRIPVPSAELIIPFCDLCTRISETVLEIQPSGPAKISVENLTTTQVPDWFFSADDAGGSLDVLLDEDARDPFYAAQSFSRSTCSQLGGFPTWLQDAEYPRCETCMRTMNFLMQIDSDEFEELYPGTFYFFKCDVCTAKLSLLKQTS